MARIGASWLVRVAVVSATACLVLWLVYEGAVLAGASSEQATCARNLRLLGQAAEMYQNDFDCLVPYGRPFYWPRKGEMWPALLEPYLTRRISNDSPQYPHVGKVYRCPSVRSVCFCMPRSCEINPYCGGWMPEEKPAIVPLPGVRFPSRTVMMAETSWPEGHGGTLFAPTPNKPVDYARPPARHFGRLNLVLWIDGHVSSMTNEEYLREDDGPSNGNVWCRLERPKPAVR